MGEQHGGRSGRRALAALIATAVVSAVSLVAPTAAHAVLTGTLAAVDDNYKMTFTTAGTALNVAAPGVLANDSGPAGNTTTVDLIDSDVVSLNGANVFLHANGSFTYKPDPTVPFTGIDQFTYWIQDSPNGDQDFATVYVEVDPVVLNHVYYVHKNTTLNVAAPGVFANDLGLDPANALYTSDSTSARGGAVTVNADGSFSYVPPAPTFEGTDSFSYTASDSNGDNTFPATVTVHVDSTAPTISMTSPAAYVTGSTHVGVGWSGSDPSGIARYDVQSRHAAWNGAFTAWATWKAGTTLSSTTYFGNPGQSYCFRARAIDNAGNVSNWSSQRCTAVPMSSTGLTYTGHWTKTTRTDVWGGVEMSSTIKGAVASRTSVHAKRLYLIAAKCASCGTVQVRWNNVAVANVNLAYPATVRNQVYLVGSFAGVTTGTLTVIVTSASGKTVAVEGLAGYGE